MWILTINMWFLLFLPFVFSLSALNDSIVKDDGFFMIHLDGKRLPLKEYLYDRRCFSVFSGYGLQDSDCKYHIPRCIHAHSRYIAQSFWNNTIACFGTYDANMYSPGTIAYSIDHIMHEPYGYSYGNIHAIILSYQKRFYYVPGVIQDSQMSLYIENGRICIDYDNANFISTYVSDISRSQGNTLDEALNFLSTVPVLKYPVTFLDGDNSKLKRVSSCKFVYIDVCLDSFLTNKPFAAAYERSQVCTDVIKITLWTEFEIFAFSLIMKFLHLLEFVMMEIVAIFVRVIVSFLLYVIQHLNTTYMFIELMIVTTILYVYNPKFIRAIIISLLLFAFLGLSRDTSIFPKLELIGDWLVSRLEDISEFSV
ncbi:MAG: hypothetical protein FuVV1_gp4 [Hangzhou Virga-like virus 1]|nr:MAG: hypothetical protein FuVV1_gp4 [Hangzhou Virga-like virus 1]